MSAAVLILVCLAAWIAVIQEPYERWRCRQPRLARLVRWVARGE